MKEKFPVAGILKLLEKEKDFVFLESAKSCAENYLSYLFLRPKQIVATSKIERLPDCFRQLNQALKKGFYVAGFLSYEAGEAFEERLTRRENYDFPLLWFGIYKKAALIYHHRRESFAGALPKAIKKVIVSKNYKKKKYLLKNIQPNITQNSYLQAIRKIKNLIAQGFTYQVNFTFKLKFAFSGSPAALYLNLRNNQSVAYSALIKAGRYFILSFSPELFFRKKGLTLLTRPMKGTIRRGKDLKEDAEHIQQLKHCLKNRSENVMIVDLLRNDLGRISACGSVRVPRLFNVEKYETLFQMTSDIQSKLASSNSAFDIFSHIFPSGSVTGAPKIKTMQIIRKLEKEPRRIYTGSIGFFSPDRTGVFNVAIRTILLDSHRKAGEMGVGSGIVYDSSAQEEFAECLLKADFLTKQCEDFQLIETMLWRPDRGYLLLDEHLKRLKNSARYFNFQYEQKNVLRSLMKLEHSLGQNNYKVRLVLSKDGDIKLESSLLKLTLSPKPKICLSAKQTCINNPFLYHKTTNRQIYDAEYKRYKDAGYYDVIFTNEKGEITEGAISNIFIRQNGKFYTPPISSGLLDGVYRRYLLESKNLPIEQKLLFKEDLRRAEEIYLCNSVRGLVRVYLEAKNN